MVNQAPRPAVMYDVARLAGVSHQTVSRVLNNHPNVRPETRERVRHAIEQLNYRHNKLARGLATRRSGRIGVVTAGSRLYGPTSTLIGIERAARRAGYTVSLTAVDAPSEVQAALERLAEQSVEGIIVIAPARASAVVGSIQGVPVLSVGATTGDARALSPIDEPAGAALATGYLLDLGHRTVWHLSGPADSADALERARGWRQALAEAGAQAPPALCGDWSAASGHRAAADLASRAGVTAVFAANDQMAMGLLAGFHRLGLRVPEDVSVVGFDDIAEAAFTIPALTTVRLDFDAVGRLAVQALIAVIDGAGGRQAQALVVQADGRPRPELVVRASAAAPEPTSGPRGVKARDARMPDAPEAIVT